MDILRSKSFSKRSARTMHIFDVLTENSVLKYIVEMLVPNERAHVL